MESFGFTSDGSLFSTLFRDACAQYDKGSDRMRITSVARNGRAMLVAFIRDGVPLDALVEETNPRSVKCSIMDVRGVVERVDVMDTVCMFYQRIAASSGMPKEPEHRVCDAHFSAVSVD